MCEGLKIIKIGKSATKIRRGRGSTTNRLITKTGNIIYNEDIVLTFLKKEEKIYKKEVKEKWK